MFKVCINAGHCPGIDPGAIGPTGLQEANVVRDIALKLQHYLEQAFVATCFIQDDSLENICEFANNDYVDLFVSIHCNSASNPQANGTEIFTSYGETYADYAAAMILKQISDTFPDLYVRADYSDGDVDKEAAFYVLKNTDMPAVLIELAFISNQFEEQLLSKQSNQDMFARAIARGITDYANKF